MIIKDLATFLTEQRDAIVTRFVAEVRATDPVATDLALWLVVDHVPAFLDEIAGELQRGRVRAGDAAQAGAALPDDSRTAQRHGEQRWRIGYDLRALVLEYGTLRRCILAMAAEAEVGVTIAEFEVLAHCLHQAIAAAAAAYAQAHDQELEARNANLAFAASAGKVLSASLDYQTTVQRLGELLVPRLADWCAVQLEGTSVEQIQFTHVEPAQAALLRELYQRFPLPDDSSLSYRSVIRSGQPQIFSASAFEPLEKDFAPEQRELLQRLATRSWVIIPLLVQDTVFGTLTVAYSSSGRTYHPHDLVLLGDVGQRASMALHNAQLYEQSQRERERVEAATRAKDEFVAMVSHELRTPLSAILGWASLLRAGKLPPVKQQHAFEVIERNAMAQGQIVGDLLDISRVITGKMRIQPSQLDFSNVIDMAVEGVRVAADAKRITVEVDLAREGVMLRADGDRLLQVVWKLLVNAVKFTPKGGRVWVRLRRIESDLELAVSDTGIGIAADFIPHMFESFRQAIGGTTRSHGGLGIGLSISKHIVELHGGSIHVASAGPGQGTTFTVRLPISPLVSTTLGIGRVPEHGQLASDDAASGLVGLRVLLVDDDNDARELLGYVLEARGMEVRLAASVAEALRVLEAFTPSLIVSDIGMPEQDGYALIRAVRALDDPAKSGVPAIALTAFATTEDRARALAEGFDLHLVKPVEPSALVKAAADLAASGRPRERV